MEGLTKYKCEVCGQFHDDWPALTWDSPSQYNELSQEEKRTIASLDLDFCVINHPDQTDRFIRVTLTQKVNDHCDALDYGVWVSLSESSFQDYSSKYGDPQAEVATYFGWLCNYIPGYDRTLSIPMTVTTRLGKLRPDARPHSDHDAPFVSDYYNGIDRKEAERRVHELLDVVGKRNQDDSR